MPQEQQELSEEQIRALQEKIKQMSPEELKEFQKKQCIFCQIIAGKVQSRKIYEDEKVFGILDINPANPGHVLLLTKEHYSIMPQIPNDEIAHVFVVAKSLSNSMLRGIDVQGTNIIVANGIAAGQKAQHFITHVIPRKENDGVDFVLPQKAMEQSEIEAIGNKLISALGAREKPEEKQEAWIPETSKKNEVPEFKKPEALSKKEAGKEVKDAGRILSEIKLDDIAKLLGGK